MPVFGDPPIDRVTQRARDEPRRVAPRPGPAEQARDAQRPGRAHVRPFLVHEDEGAHVARDPVLREKALADVALQRGEADARVGVAMVDKKDASGAEPAIAIVE